MEKTKLIEPLTKSVALATAVLYGLGFVVVNAYLSKFGTSDFSLTNPRFVFAGVLCAMYLFFWWYFVGNYMLQIDRALSIAYVPSMPRFKKFVLLSNYMFTEVIFRIAIASVIFSSTTFEGSSFLDPASGLILFPALGSIFLEKIMPSIEGFLYILFKSILKLIIVPVFLILSDTNQQLLFGSYFVFFFLFMLFHEQITKKIHDDQSVTALIYFSTFILGAVITFGYSMYGETKTQYGGGHSVNVSIIAKENLPNDLVFQDVDKRFKALLIYSTDKWSLLQIPNRNLLLNQDQIKGLVFPERTETINPRLIFEERMKRKGIHWFESSGAEAASPDKATDQEKSRQGTP